MKKIDGLKQKQRQSFTFYLSFEESISELGNREQLILYKAIAQYSLFGKEPDSLTGVAKMVWKLLFPVLNKSRTNYLNGLKGGAPEGNSNNRYTNGTTKIQPKNNPKYNTDTYTETYTETEPKKNSSTPNGLESIASNDTMPETRLYSRLFLDNKDFIRVQKMWNDTCESYRRVVKLTSKTGGRRNNRKGKICACLDMLYKTEGTKERAFELLQEVFNKVEKSKFLAGDNQRGWKACFDWVMQTPHLIKIIEGNYDN